MQARRKVTGNRAVKKVASRGKPTTEKPKKPTAPTVEGVNFADALQDQPYSYSSH